MTIFLKRILYLVKVARQGPGEFMEYEHEVRTHGYKCKVSLICTCKNLFIEILHQLQ